MIDQAQTIGSLKNCHICLNPHCKNLFKRVFLPNSEHDKLQDCSRWIVNLSMFYKNSVIYNNKKNNGSQNLNNKSNANLKLKDPIFIQIKQKLGWTIFNSQFIQTETLNQLKKSVSRIRQICEKSLDSVQAVLSIKIQDYFAPLKFIKKQIIDFLTQFQDGKHIKGIQSLKINQIFNHQKFRQLLKLQDMAFFPQIRQQQQKLKHLFNSLPEHLICSKQCLTSDISLSYQQKNNLIKYLKDPIDQHNKKLSKLALLLKSQQRSIYEKRNKQQSAAQFILKCPICSANFTTQKRKQVMNMWNNIYCEHLIGSHFEQIGYSYRHLVSLSANGRITIQDIIYRMTKYSYQSIELVYKTGRHYYNFHYSNRKKLSIDISMKGQSRYNLPFIQIGQVHQYYCIVSIIAYSLKHFANPVVQRKPVYIFNNSISDVSYLRRLCQIFNLDNIKFVVDKRSEESTVFYQDYCSSQFDQIQLNQKPQLKQEEKQIQ